MTKKQMGILAVLAVLVSISVVLQWQTEDPFKPSALRGDIGGGTCTDVDEFPYGCLEKTISCVICTDKKGQFKTETVTGTGVGNNATNAKINAKRDAYEQLQSVSCAGKATSDAEAQLTSNNPTECSAMMTTCTPDTVVISGQVVPNVDCNPATSTPRTPGPGYDGSIDCWGVCNCVKTFEWANRDQAIVEAASNLEAQLRGFCQNKSPAACATGCTDGGTSSAFLSDPPDFADKCDQTPPTVWVRQCGTCQLHRTCTD